MFNTKFFLVAAGTISAAIALLHVIMLIKPAWWEYVSGGVKSPLAEQAIRGSTGTQIATAVLAVIFAVWSLYAFSGAGLIGTLPWLKPILIVIGAIYVLRSLAIFTEVNTVRNDGAPIQIVFFSIISFVTGLLYILGVWKL
jgi:hypothetical protein